MSNKSSKQPLPVPRLTVYKTGNNSSSNNSNHSGAHAGTQIDPNITMYPINTSGQYDASFTNPLAPLQNPVLWLKVGTAVIGILLILVGAYGIVMQNVNPVSSLVKNYVGKK